MSPVNNDPSISAAGGGMPLTRKELRARERFLSTQNHNVVPVPEATPGEDVQSAAGATEPDTSTEPDVATEPDLAAEPDSAHAHLPRPVPAVPPAPSAPPVPASPPASASQVPDAETSSVPLTVDSGSPKNDASHADVPHEDVHLKEHPVEEHHAGDHPVDEHFQAGDHHDPAYDEHLHDEHVYGDHHDDHHHDDHFHDDHHDDHHDLITPVEVPGAKAAAKKARRRRRVVALLITLGVFVAAIAIGAQFLKPLLGMDKVTDYPGPGTGSVNITVAEGSGPKIVATTLQQNKIIADADSFVKEFMSEGAELSPGTFTFRTEMKNSDAVAVLANKDSSKVMYFALSAGLRITESLEAISKGSGIPLQQLNALNQAPAQFGVPAKAKNLEGFLAPGEYRFELGTSANDILQKLVNTTLDELKSQGITDPAKQYDTVTIASIVQAEGGQADYGNVAGAIYNRLKPNNVETSGLIQSDATVTYGLGRKSFHVTEEEKADKSNPYNTYANVGLPVGPIGSPGKTAIDAAAKPTPNDYMYWVTINLDTKETKFSKTLAEHNTYVEQYNAWCQANAGRCV
ncbi:endolytic transglycosylase MltG [Paenarthrobacter ilicis]|uniref:endolytic transglycosylase MltG n=1 Tax=Paenarthrobacter ilicis TaxID=43665 RepID=UPI003870C3F5